MQRREKESSASVSFSSIPKGKERGPGKEEVNDDVVFVDTENNVYAVCDGAGVDTAGMAVKRALGQDLLALRKREGPQSKEEWGEYLRSILLHASDILRTDKSLAGTTVVLAKLIKEGKRNFAVIVHVGDSRAYKYQPNKKDGQLECLTLDDRLHLSSEVGEKELKALQDKEDNEPYILGTKRQANLTLAKDLDVLTKKDDIHISFTELEKDASLVLTCDGINDNLTTNEMIGSLDCEENENPASNLTVKARAMSRSRLPLMGERNGLVPRAKSDDMSAIVIKIVK